MVFDDCVWLVVDNDFEAVFEFTGAVFHSDYVNQVVLFYIIWLFESKFF